MPNSAKLIIADPGRGIGAEIRADSMVGAQTIGAGAAEKCDVSEVLACAGRASPFGRHSIHYPYRLSYRKGGIRTPKCDGEGAEDHILESRTIDETSVPRRFNPIQTFMKEFGGHGPKPKSSQRAVILFRSNLSASLVSVESRTAWPIKFLSCGTW